MENPNESKPNNLTAKIGLSSFPLTREIAEKMSYSDPSLEFIETDITMTDLVRKWRGFKGCSRPLLQRRALEEDWQGKRKLFREKLIAEIMNRDVKDMKEMNKRHLRAAQLLQDKGSEFLGITGFKSDGNAVMGIAEGVKIERLVAGEPESIIEIRDDEDEETIKTRLRVTLEKVERYKKPNPFTNGGGKEEDGGNP